MPLFRPVFKIWHARQSDSPLLLQQKEIFDYVLQRRLHCTHSPPPKNKHGSAMTLFRQRLRGGFSIIEMAVIMGVIGIVLSGMWTATTAVYNSYRMAQVAGQIAIIRSNIKTFWGTTSTTAYSNQNNAWSATEDQNCPNITQCSTGLMLQAGVFPPNFISTTNLVSGAAYGVGGHLYTTSRGFTLWTGVYDCGVYTAQQTQLNGYNGPTPCSGQTVVELDLFGMTVMECSSLLINLINAQVDGLVDVSTASNGWGPVIGVFYGNQTLPQTMSLPTAITACSPAGSYFAYVTGAKTYLWLVFSSQ